MCGEDMRLLVCCGLSIYSKHLCEMNEWLRTRRVEMYNQKFKIYTFRIILGSYFEEKLFWRKKSWNRGLKKSGLFGNTCSTTLHYFLQSKNIFLELFFWSASEALMMLGYYFFYFKSASDLPHLFVWISFLTWHLSNMDNNKQ